MNTSAPSPLSAAELEALRRLFWRHGIMQKYRSYQGTGFRVPDTKPFDPVVVSAYLFGEGDLVKPSRRWTEFLFIGNLYAYERWVAVICKDHVIVPPFRLPDAGREFIPPFPEEL